MARGGSETRWGRGAKRAAQWGLGLAVLVAATACGASLSDNPVDEDANILPNKDVSQDVPLPSDGTASGDDCGCLQKGMVFRFDNLQIKSLDGNPEHLVIGTLNPLWKGDIDKKELNFYIEIQDVAGTEFQLRIVNGARIDSAGAVCTLPVTSNVVTMKREGCKIKNLLPTALNVYAGTSANPKNCTTGLEVPHSIPVRNVLFEAEIAPGCGAIAKGNLIQASIPKDSLDGTCTCLTLGGKPAEACGVPDPSYPGKPSPNNVPGEPPTFCTECCKGCNSNFTNLKELLVMFGELQYKCKDEKDKPSVCLSAEFNAPKVDAMPADCKL